MTTLMYDSTDPKAIPADASYLAIYANGDFAANRDQVQASHPRARIFTIDVLGTDPAASIKDVETGDIKTSTLASVIRNRYGAHPDALTRVYCNLSTWPAARAAVSGLAPPIRRTVRWWIANPTGQPHFVPGSNGTQYEWGTDFDVSVIGPNFIGY